MSRSFAFPPDSTAVGLAQRWRVGPGRALLSALQQDLDADGFEPERALRSWGQAEASWREAGGEPGQWHALPWDARGTMCDTGQAGNDYCGRDVLRHPLLAACRYGSPESIAWLCAREGVDPVVAYEDVSEFWAFDRAASSGISGAFDPLWKLARRNGWGMPRLGEALASWLIGAQDGPAAVLHESLAQAAPALAWLMERDPGFALPLAPSSVFGSALGASLVHEGLDREGTARVSAALIGFAPPSVWRHESQMDDSPIHENCREDPSAARTFAEEALAVGNPEGLRLLMRAGHPMPTPERAWESLGGQPATDAHWSAYRIIQERAAAEEAREIAAHAPQPDGGMRPARAL